MEDLTFDLRWSYGDEEYRDALLPFDDGGSVDWEKVPKGAYEGLYLCDTVWDFWPGIAPDYEDPDGVEFGNEEDGKIRVKFRRVVVLPPFGIETVSLLPQRPWRLFWWRKDERGRTTLETSKGLIRRVPLEVAQVVILERELGMEPGDGLLMFVDHRREDVSRGTRERGVDGHETSDGRDEPAHAGPVRSGVELVHGDGEGRWIFVPAGATARVEL
jgi:hypothetical protein